MSNENYLKELLKWISPDSILVIDKSGKLRRVYVPFWVVSLVDFPDITKGQKVPVDAVKLTVEVKEVYVIKGTTYYIIFFKIILDS
jgi:hypothetical protein